MSLARVVILGSVTLLVGCATGPRPSPATRVPLTAENAHLGTGRWVRILATNDFHGTLEPRRDSRGVLRGGAATLAAEIQRARDECSRAPGCAALLVDGGDQFQGTPASNLGFGRPVVTLFNRFGLVAAALGNHEFDWGQDTLRARMREAAYPILGANVTFADGSDVPWIPNDTIVTTGGIRVGILGLATMQTPTTTRPANVSDLRFADPIPIVNRHARSLRDRGAQMVIVIAHAGAFCNGQPPTCDGEIVTLARGVTERIDAIVSGHTHSPVTTVINGIPIVQARSHGSALGVLDVPLVQAAPVLALRDVLPDRIAPDPAIDSLVQAVVGPLQALVNRPIATVAERMSDLVLGNFMADAFRAAGGGDVGVMNRGGVRAPIDSGTVTYGELFEVAPFGNMLVRLTLTGAGMRAWLEKAVGQRTLLARLSGVVVTYDTTRATGGRIVSVTMSDGQPLANDRTYRFVYSDFLHANGDGLQATEGIQRVEELGIVDIDALTEWVRRGSPVRAPRDTRLIARP